ncbi:hypothetical protein NLI96_g7414 [Meripilus lineatus]|uniref:Uncharacterized protein n=1 Tax=Meripilus lineatus TaxID=2056292 RepID=A0AAD5YH84_9APHY|nr:hypothetical protein NLI96_g7414 [Physisporinus lineatus]
MNILKCCHNLLRLKYQTPDEEHVSVNTSVNPHSNQPTENPLANFQALRFVGRMPLPLWEGMETLSEAPNSNRIITSFQDRTTSVWQQTPDSMTGQLIWEPTLVALRINRSATFVRWSPNEDKFAVTSSTYGGRRSSKVCALMVASVVLMLSARSTPQGDRWVLEFYRVLGRSAPGSADMKAQFPSTYTKDVDHILQHTGIAVPASEIRLAYDSKMLMNADMLGGYGASLSSSSVARVLHPAGWAYFVRTDVMVQLYMYILAVRI